MTLMKKSEREKKRVNKGTNNKKPKLISDEVETNEREKETETTRQR